MSAYTVYILPDAFREIKQLPGSVRQRVRRAVEDLASEPRPAQSKPLKNADAEIELRRLRLEKWRTLYSVK